MPDLPARSDLATHTVENQPTPFQPNLWESDPALRALSDETLKPLAEALCRPEALEAARAANAHPPELVSHGPDGRRLDEVRFHPGYHDLLRMGLEAGYAALPWEGEGGHRRHAAMVYLFSQIEPGVCCPMTMTYAASAALEGPLAETWRPKLLSRVYDPSIRPISEKAGATLGMAMTEKQGGSDIRANTTRAEPAGDHYRLTGHKWFCSAPMSDGFLTLAQAPGGLTCFLVPRWLEDGRNAIHLQRLKDKLGNHANASAEIEYHGALAWRLGEEGQGIRAIIPMVHHTRLDTAMAPPGLMRAAIARAHAWVSRRSAFQRRLIDQPLMAQVLADLALDWEGALALGLRTATAFDDRSPLARIAVALAKYLANKRAPWVIAEAMECLGGMGYVEETGLPLLYREAPLNGIWEGAGNVICLDILRTLARDPAAAEALEAELAVPEIAAALQAHRSRWPRLPDEGEARAFAESLATLLTAATLFRTGPTAIAEAYLHARLTAPRGHAAGAVTGLDPAPILARLNA